MTHPLTVSALEDLDFATLLVKQGESYVQATAAILVRKFSEIVFSQETLRAAIRDYAFDADRYEVEAIARLYEAKVGVSMLKGAPL